MGDKTIGTAPTGGYGCQATRLVVEPEVGVLRSVLWNLAKFPKFWPSARFWVQVDLLH